MQVLIIGQAEVNRLLPVSECMDVMARALETLARGDAILPLRSVVWLPGRAGVLVTMPSCLGDIRKAGIKAFTAFAGNAGTEFPSHQGVVLLFEIEHGQLLAIVDASEITAIRTAAVSGVATRLLARADAGDLAILGSGDQARSHLAAMLAARKIGRVRVWSRNPTHAREFAERASRQHGIAVEAVASADKAVTGADIVCTTTSAQQPVLKGEWLAPGAHINAVGSSIPSARELDTAAVARARLFVDRRESTINEAGDFLFPKQEGVIGDDHIQGEIGDILLGKVRGRESASEITLFKSLGLAVEDLAASYRVYEKALEQHIGVFVELGGSRHDQASKTF